MKQLVIDANTLCNSMDSEMLKLTKSLKESPCIIPYPEDKVDIYTKMYHLNEAFKLVAEARSLLHKIKDNQ
jgi:hypothetical protein